MELLNDFDIEDGIFFESETWQTKVSKSYKISQIEKLYDFIKTCEYGFISPDGETITSPTDEDFWNRYKLSTPDEFQRNKIGVCWDYASYEYDVLDSYGISCRLFYIQTQFGEDDFDTHTFVIANTDHNNFYYIEGSFKRYMGIYHIYTENEEKVVDIVSRMIAKNMLELRTETNKAHYSVWDYTDSQPSYGCSCKEFMDHIWEHGELLINDKAISNKTPIDQSIQLYHEGSIAHGEFDIGMCDTLPPGISVRQATDSDIDTIEFMEMETIPEEYRSLPDVIKSTREDAEWSVSFTTMIIDKITGESIGIYQSRPTNYSATSTSGDWWYIADIYVLPEYRGRGIARALISYDISKHDKLVLRVASDNVHAWKLYESLGFRITERPEGEYIMRIDKTNNDNKIMEESVKMKKNLFFEMEVDDDDDNMSSGYGSMDFDFDSDTPESSSDDQSIDDTPKSAEEGPSTAYDDSIRKLESKINHKLPKDFVEGVSVFNDPWIYCNTTIKKDGKIIFCVDEMYNIKEIIQRFDYIEDPTLMALASDGYGNHIVMRITDNTYHVWYHDRWDGDKNLMIQIAAAFNDTEGNPDNLIAVLDAGEKLDTSNTDDVTQEAFGPDDYRSYIDDYLKKAEPSAADDPVYQLELLIHDKLPKDFAEGVFIFDDKRFNNAEIRKDGEVIFIVASMWSIKDIVYNKKTDLYGITHFKVDDPIFAIGEDGYGNFVVMRTTDNTYHTLYHDKWDGDKNLMVQIATAFTGDEGNPDNLISILEAGMSSATGDNNGVTQEGMFDAGFGNLRIKIANAIGDRFKVSNIVKGMTGKDAFTITPKDDSGLDETRTTVESTGTGCKVVTRGEGKIKCHFNNISLSSAIEKIISLFKNPELLLQEALYNISRFGGSIYMEDGDEDKDDEDLDATLDSIEIDSDDEDDDDTDDTKDDVDISNFGSDTSDVQNDYNKKDVEILNHLIAGESETINDYFDGAKDSNDETLRRLYGDIGHEERFHLEQLLYAKSTLTGEKYEPRDPEVKKEYEELLAMGMDEDTAASTAIDKQGMNGVDDGDDSDMEELEQEAAMLETTLFQNEILTYYCEQFSHQNMDDTVNVFIEAYIQEEMDNVTTAPKEVKQIQNPIKLLIKGLKITINGIIRMSRIIRDTATKNKLKTYRKMEWIKKNGISGLFAGGINLFFYSDKANKFDMETPAKYVDLLYRLSKQVGENCGIRLKASATHNTIANPIRFNSISEGLNILKNVVLTKTKVIVNDNNKDALAREFFGYSDEKINVKVKHDANQPGVNHSGNIYNRLEVMVMVTQQYCKIAEDILDAFALFEGDVNSIYYKNRALYNKGYTVMKMIVDKYNEFVRAMAHDLKTLIKLDNGILNMTRERDIAEQTGGKWEGEDIRVSKKPVPNKQTQTQNRVPTKGPHKW